MYEMEKDAIRKWFYKYACGSDNACERSIPVVYLCMSDRTFREICAEIPEIITSSRNGYYIIPKDASAVETRMAENIINEHRSRIINLYKRFRAQRSYINSLKQNNKQMELAI